jgi:hypothetical protein
MFVFVREKKEGKKVEKARGNSTTICQREEERTVSSHTI